MKILSNARRVHGAACVLYPGVLERLAWKEGLSSPARSTR